MIERLDPASVPAAPDLRTTGRHSHACLPRAAGGGLERIAASSTVVVLATSGTSPRLSAGASATLGSGARG